MQFLGNFGKIVYWRPSGELAPSPRGNPGSATDKINVNIQNIKDEEINRLTKSTLLKNSQTFNLQLYNSNI